MSKRKIWKGSQVSSALMMRVGKRSEQLGKAGKAGSRKEAAGRNCGATRSRQRVSAKRLC